MLEWDSKPADSRTAYMGLEEFRGRKVLPPPTAIAGQWLPVDDAKSAELPRAETSGPGSVLVRPAARETPQAVTATNTSAQVPALSATQEPQWIRILNNVPANQVAGRFAALYKDWSIMTDDAQRRTVGLALKHKVDACWKGGKKKSEYATLVKWLDEHRTVVMREPSQQ